MLRSGINGDWIGTFFGHKGAVYQARLSPDAKYAATASADFTAKVWDTYTGETLYTIQHAHVVRAVAFPPESGTLLATGGTDKKLYIFDLTKVAQAGANGTPTSTGAGVDSTINAQESGFEIGPGVHKGTIKAVVWTRDPNIIVTAADDKVIRWWDLRTQSVVQEQKVDGDIGSCEFSNIKSEPGDIGDGLPILSIAAGKTLYFYGGPCANTLLKKVVLGYEVASVAIHPIQRKYITGGIKDTWAKVYDFDSDMELDLHKGHHGPIWSISFSPDGKLYATGSEDGTIKMWKNCIGSFGLWRAEG